LLVFNRSAKTSVESEMANPELTGSAHAG
jgi:hypothetical protein